MINDIQKARILSCYKTEEYSLEKGGKVAFIGEIRSFGGRDYIKTTEGWKFHGKGTGEKAKEHAKSTSTHIEAKKEPTFSEKYPGNTSELHPNSFAFKRDEAVSKTRYYITNVTDKNIMYEREDRRYSTRAERMSIELFLERLGGNQIHYTKLPRLEEALSKVATSESDAYKNMILDLKNQTTGLKEAYIAKTKSYRENQFDFMVKKYGQYTYEDWLAKFPAISKWNGSRETTTVSKEGNQLRAEVSAMKREGKEKYVKSYMKLAEMHYNQSLEKLGYKITEAGFDTNKVKLSSSSVGVNFSTEVTDGTKYMRAYTIIAEGPIKAPHYRYLFTSNKQK